ncbi:hypothetical protein ACEN2T_17790 [Pseudomonas sp. W22_MBD1_FP4]|uniref:hypothetical protein n=1 Tax=Pseudomonas sp. W22_MBD1_FP4 TaxID=3240272 RepID=UPI003F95174A
MNKYEALAIQKTLDAKGYESRFEEFEGAIVVVRDPVESSVHGRQYKDVTLRSVASMRDFVHARS